MGAYYNPNNNTFSDDLNNDIYIDKTMLLAKTNACIGKSSQKFLCILRPRRFGKSMAANMLTAYYSKGCDSRELFKGLKIENDPSFEENLNKYDVIRIDFAAVGAIGGVLSSGFAEIAGTYGGKIGLAFSQTAHMGTGITFGKVFGTSTLIAVGNGTGKVLGTIAGATFGDYYGNRLFGREYSLSEKLGELIRDEIPGLLYDFLRWAL